MKKIIFLFLALYSLTMSAEIKRPKLVVGLVVDQMRWDYLYYYYNEFGEGGLKRLVDEGYSFENTMINYVPTITAIGHTSLYTGTTPAIHGICGNNFYIEGRAKQVYCSEDTTVHSVGSDSKEGLMSPRNMLSTTIGDQLRLATDFRSKVIGVAMKDRASIFPAGHSANAAYWWDKSAGHYITSSYYMDQLPQWVQQFNKKHQLKKGFDVKATDDGVTLTFQMAEEAIAQEHLGEGQETDMLCVSISSTDVIAHAHGTRGQENKSVFMRLDRDLAHFLQVLDQKYGRDGYLLFLSADHGGAHNPNFMRNHKLPAAGIESWVARKEWNRQLSAATGIQGDVIKTINSGRVYLDHELISKAGVSISDVKAKAIEMFKKDQRFEFVIDFEKASTSTVPQLIRERIINGYHPHRSGDIFLAPLPQYIDTSNSSDYVGTTHGMWNPYDSHIPFVLLGWNVKHGATNEPTNIVDVAPTICAMLHIQMPNGCIGTSKTMKP